MEPESSEGALRRDHRRSDLRGRDVEYSAAMPPCQTPVGVPVVTAHPRGGGHSLAMALLGNIAPLIANRIEYRISRRSRRSSSSTATRLQMPECITSQTGYGMSLPLNAIQGHYCPTRDAQSEALLHPRQPTTPRSARPCRSHLVSNCWQEIV